jgi:hypothetical protein
MHVHLPKAFHGWREFAKEVGIIVLGVLIALGFEQVVQAWHWRVEARHTRQALTNEAILSALWAEERIAVQQCLRERIAQLATKLNNGGPNWTADPVILGRARNPMGRETETAIPAAYHTPHRPWLTDEWETAKSTGIVDHMDREDVRLFEFVFRTVSELRNYQNEETMLAPQVSFLSFNQSLDPQSRVQTLVTLARLDYINGMEGQMAREMLLAARATHLPMGRMQIGPRTTTFPAATNQVVTALRDRYGSCVIEPRIAEQQK